MISGQFKHYLDHILRDNEKKCKTEEISSVNFIFAANWKKTITYTILVMEHLSPGHEYACSKNHSLGNAYLKY